MIAFTFSLTSRIRLRLVAMSASMRSTLKMGLVAPGAALNRLPVSAGIRKDDGIRYPFDYPFSQRRGVIHDVVS